MLENLLAEDTETLRLGLPKRRINDAWREAQS